MRRVVFMVFIFFLFSSLLYAKTPPLNKEPMNYATCTSSGCHAELKQKKYIHDPIKAHGCHLCHTPVMGKHKFEFSSRFSEMCTICHDNLEQSKRKKLGKHFVIEEEGQSFSTHPLAKQDFSDDIQNKILSWGLKFYDNEITCLTCHNPHGSDTQHLIRPLKKQNEGKKPLCFSCHEEKTKSHNHPLKEDTCTQCHHFHQGIPDTPLLGVAKNKRDPICLQCHQEKTSIFNTKHDYYLWPSQLQKEVSGFFEYPTKITIRCELCHTIHHTKTEGSFLLTSKTNEQSHAVIALCVSCHQNVKATSIPQIKYIFKHIPMLFSSVSDPKTGKEITLNFFSSTGKKIKGDDELFEFSCATCHNPHQWSRDKSMDKESKPTLHSAFLINSEDTMKFCASCHGKEARTLYTKFHEQKPESNDDAK